MKRKILALALAAMCLGSAAAANVTPGAVIAAEDDTAQTAKNMTLDDVKELAKKGKKLDWTDFSDYNIKWRSTIAYTRFCKVELGSEFFLVVGGEPNLRPDVVWLCYKDTETYVDVKTGDVSAFISKYAKTDTVTTTTAATTTTTAKTTTTTAKATTTTAKTTTTTAKTTTTAAKTTTVTTSVTTLLATVKGDANCDGQMDMADVVLIMQAMANPNKYGIDGTAEHHLTEQGKLNGDMDGNGLTVGDALAIQRKLLGIVECEKLTIKLNTLIPQNGSEYVEMEPYNAMVSSYDVSLSSLNGVGVWFEFESPSYPITLTTKNGSFKTFTYNGGGLGTINDEGSTYKLDKSGSVSFVPETVSIPDDYKAEVMITGEENGKTVDLGTLVITKTDKNTKGVLSVTFKKAGNTTGVDNSALAGKTFVYEKEGFGSDFEITFDNDGWYLYSEGDLSSFIGIGTWEIKDDTVVMTDSMPNRVNYLKINGSDLVYIADGSDNFYHIKVKDGEKFSQKPDSAVLLGIDKAKISGVNVSSLPAGYDYSFKDENAQAVVDYLSNLSLSTELSVEDPGQLNGMTWVIKLDCEDGNTITLYDMGRFIHGEDRQWYEMPYEESQGFSSLIWKLGE